MSLTAKEIAANIRKELKSVGYTSKQVSVRKSPSGYVVSVTVKDKNVPLHVVEAFAKGHEEPSVLCEHNGFDGVYSSLGVDVRVEYTYEIQKELREEFEAKYADAIAELKEKGTAFFGDVQVLETASALVVLVSFTEEHEERVHYNLTNIALAFHNHA